MNYRDHGIQIIKNLSPHLICSKQIEEIISITDQTFSVSPWHMKNTSKGMIETIIRFEPFLFLAKLEEKIIGYSIGVVLSDLNFSYFKLQPGESMPGDYHISLRAVLPEYRKLGIGQDLTTVRLRHAKEIGCQRVYADTNTGNINTLKMLYSIGFQEFRNTKESNSKFESKTVFLKKIINQKQICEVQV